MTALERLSDRRAGNLHGGRQQRAETHRAAADRVGSDGRCDAAEDPRTRSTAEQLSGISAEAFINMPLVEQGRFVALFFANNATPRPWPEDDITLMREVADRVRAASERARAEQAQKAATVHGHGSVPQ